MVALKRKTTETSRRCSVGRFVLSVRANCAVMRSGSAVRSARAHTRLLLRPSSMNVPPLSGIADCAVKGENGRIVLKNSVGGSVERISSKSQNLASSNISDLAWRPTRRNRSRSSEFALSGVFQHNRQKAVVGGRYVNDALAEADSVSSPSESTWMFPGGLLRLKSP